MTKLKRLQNLKYVKIYYAKTQMLPKLKF